MTKIVQLMLSKASYVKKGCYACQSLYNAKLYKYTKFYQHIPCGSRVLSVFSNCSLTTFGRTHTPKSTRAGCLACADNIIFWLTRYLCIISIIMLKCISANKCITRNFRSTFVSLNRLTQTIYIYTSENHHFNRKAFYCNGIVLPFSP